MRRLLVLVSAIVFVDTMLYAALVPLLPHYERELGLGKDGAGLLVGAYAAGALVGAIPGGLAAARFGPQRAVLAGLSLMAVASVCFGFAGDPISLGSARLAQGVGSALSWAGALTWLVAGTPRSRRGEMLGTAMGSAIFGALLGPAVGAAAEHAGPRPVFIGLAGLTLALATWARATPRVEAEPQPLRAVLRAVREPTVVGALWLMVVPALLFGVLGVLVPLALDRSGWSAAEIAALFIASAAVEMVVAPFFGRFSDRVGRLRPLRLALVGAAIATSLLTVVDRPPGLAVLVVFAGVSFGALWAPALALLSDGAERIGLTQGLAFGLMNGAWGLGNTVGPSVGGSLAEEVGDALPYALMAAVCAATLLAVSRRGRLGTHAVRVPEST